MMNATKSIAWLLFFVLGLFACSSDEENSSLETNIQLATDNAKVVNMTNAVLSGTVTSASLKNTEVGIAYCLVDKAQPLVYVKATDFEEGSGYRLFSVTLSDLQPDADYTYYAYAREADGRLVQAKEQKRLHTRSPEELLKYATMQWVAVNDATFSWDLTGDEVCQELAEHKFNASFGITWSDKSDNRSGAPKKR